MYEMFPSLAKMAPMTITHQFITENFFNTLNLVRMFEFTLLDLIKISKDKQVDIYCLF